ncbi:MAG: hypothetical protein DA394_06465 [Candidatus Arcticimaribacter sp.]|nr:MAG: hypothetical protein DA394_06465 [Candidatus Arcticimaribacter sp.]
MYECIIGKKTKASKRTALALFISTDKNHLLHKSYHLLIESTEIALTTLLLFSVILVLRIKLTQKTPVEC